MLDSNIRYAEPSLRFDGQVFRYPGSGMHACSIGFPWSPRFDFSLEPGFPQDQVHNACARCFGKEL